MASCNTAKYYECHKNTNNTNYQFWRQDNMPLELFSLELLSRN